MLGMTLGFTGMMTTAELKNRMAGMGRSSRAASA
jgi:hypothetical protein